MNYRLISIKNFGKLCTAATAWFLLATPSHAISSSFSNDDFSVSGLNDGVVDNDATSGGNINSGTIPNDGFGGFFTQDYLLLGADDSNANIGSSDTNGNSVAISNSTFTVSSLTENVTLLFDWAFQGNNATSTDDEFSLGIIQGNNVPSYKQFFKVESPSFGSNLGETITLNGFTPGEYNVLIQLNEAGGVSPLNSAAGFDNITVTTGAVPFEFSPSLGLFLMAGIFGFSRSLKSRKPNIINKEV